MMDLSRETEQLRVFSFRFHFEENVSSLGKDCAPTTTTTTPPPLCSYECTLSGPKEILSEVASLLSQKLTHEMTTSKMQGPYTWMTKLPMCRCR